MDGQPPSPGWSPTIPRMVTNHPKSTIRKCSTDFTKSGPGELSWMVSHHPQDGHQPSKGWAPTILNLPGEMPWMVNHHPQDGQQPFQGWSPTIQNIP